VDVSARVNRQWYAADGAGSCGTMSFCLRVSVLPMCRFITPLRFPLFPAVFAAGQHRCLAILALPRGFETHFITPAGELFQCAGHGSSPAAP